jgi:hypothetical protein
MALLLGRFILQAVPEFEEFRADEIVVAVGEGGVIPP